MRALCAVACMLVACVDADYSAGGMLGECPPKPEDCAAGYQCENGYCTPESELLADSGIIIDAGFNDSGSIMGDAGPSIPRDCQAIKAANLAAENGTYTIDPDGPGGESSLQALCDMTIAGGGWTRVINIQNGAITWNAWSERVDVENSASSWRRTTTGLGISRFSDTTDGEDLEYLFFVENRQRGSLYRGVNRRAWDPRFGPQEFDSSFEYRSLDETDWVICDQALNHANDDWNWSIASDPAGSCTRLGGGDAFLLRGGDEHGAEAAERLYGLKSFFGAENWIAVSVYVRRTP